MEGEGKWKARAGQAPPLHTMEGEGGVRPDPAYN